MRILLTNHQLADFAGSELYTYELAKGLTGAGHLVTVYSRYIDKFAPLFQAAKIPLVSDLAQIRDQTFDIAHVHHNINAMEVRLTFPHLPIFFLAHGAHTFLEYPPSLDINVTQYAAISSLVKEQNLLRHGIKRSAILTLSSIIDSDRFHPTRPLALTPQRALVISNHIDQPTLQTIKAACHQQHISVRVIGAVGQKVNNLDLPKYINQADIVFTLGRGVLEAMLCGRIPIILDYKGGDGMVTTKNYSQLERFHFNGGFRHKTFTVQSLVKEIQKYQAAEGENLRKRTVQRYSVAAAVKQLLPIYERTIKKYRTKTIDKQLLRYLVEVVQVTRLHTFSRSEKYGIRQRMYDARFKMRHWLSLT